MFLRLLTIEVRKTLKHPALWLGLAALLFLFGMFMLISHLQVANGFRKASGGLEKDLITGLAFYNWISVLVYAVIGAVIAAFDYPDRSIQLWLTRGVTRPTLLFARLTTSLFFGLMIVGFALVSLLGLSALSRTLFFGTIDASGLNVAALLPVGVRLFWSAVPYLALTVLLAVVSRSPLFAAGGTIVYGSVFEMLAMKAGDKFPMLVRYLPASLAQALQTHNALLDHAASLPAQASGIAELQTVFAIGVLFILLSMTSLVIFSRQDLGG
jgi:hypothetical protein